MVSRDERRIARELVDAKRAREGQRTRQIPHTSVELDNGESAGIVDAATDATDARALSEVQADQLGDLTDISDTSTLEATFLPERLAPGVGSAGAAFDVAVTAAERVVTALEAAQHAIDEAADAKTTSDGKNSRRRGSTQPEPPPGGWVHGDQWVVDNAEGKPVEVRVWDGSEFAPEQILAAELLVLSSSGVVRLADGVVTADAIAADAIDGMIITGAIIRTAASGQRWQIDASGIRGFDATGTQTVVLTPDGSGVSINGGLLSKKARSGGGEHVAYLLDGNLKLATRKGAPLSAPVNVAEFWADDEDGFMLGEYDDGLAYLYGASPDRYLTIKTSPAAIVIDANRPVRFIGRVDAPHLPYAMSAGQVSVPHPANTPAHAGIVVTLPAGRFTEPPIPTANMFTGSGGSQKDVARAYQSTPTTITLGVWTGDNVGTTVAHTDVISWTAVQMSEGSAAG